jgi:hypothetical protein
MSKKSLSQASGYAYYCNEGDYETGTRLAFTNDMVLTIQTTRHLHDLLEQAHKTIWNMASDEATWNPPYDRMSNVDWQYHKVCRPKGEPLDKFMLDFRFPDDEDLAKPENRIYWVDKLIEDYDMLMFRVRGYQGISNVGGAHIAHFVGDDDSHLCRWAERLYEAAAIEMRKCGCDFEPNEDEPTTDTKGDRLFDLRSWLVRDHKRRVAEKFDAGLKARAVPLVIDQAFAN